MNKFWTNANDLPAEYMVEPHGRCVKCVAIPGHILDGIFEALVSRNLKNGQT
jgi:hypothetical protein